MTRRETATLDRLRDELDGLGQENERLRQDNEQLRQDNEQLRERIRELESLLEEAVRSGKRQAAPFGRGRRQANPKKPGRKKGHPGSYRVAPEQVDATREAPPLRGCPQGHGPLEDVRRLENIEVDIPPVHPIVTRNVFYQGWCPQCRVWVYSTDPEQISTAIGAAGCHLGARARALGADLKYRLGLPFRKVQQVLHEICGLEVTAGALVHSAHRLAEQAEPTLEALIVEVQGEPVAYADETGWRVGVEPAWLWTVATPRFTVYEVALHRCATVVAELLGEDFAGYLMRDGWASYDAQLDCKMLRCLVHLKRNIAAWEQRDPAPTAATLEPFRAWIDAVFDLKRKVPHLPAETYRQRAHRLVEDLDAVLQGPYVDDGDMLLAAKLAALRPLMVPIVEDPLLPATNNLAERQLRPVIVHRKIAAGNKTPAGATTLGTLATLTTSCHQQGRRFTTFGQRLLRAPYGTVVAFWRTDYID